MLNHMTKVIGRIEQEHYKTLLTTASHHLLADEPLSIGGTDLGFSPGELLASSLASCTCITLRMYADRKNWKLESAEVEVIFFTDKETRTTNFESEIELKGDLNEEQKKRLLFIAKKCLVHSALLNPIKIKTTLK